MLRNFDDPLGFEPTRREANLAAWSPSPSASSWSPVAAVRMMGAAFCEGLAAHREYEALRSRGMAHERALREALGLGGSRLPRKTVMPLDLGGRARAPIKGAHFSRLAERVGAQTRHPIF